MKKAVYSSSARHCMQELAWQATPLQKRSPAGSGQHVHMPDCLVQHLPHVIHAAAMIPLIAPASRPSYARVPLGMRPIQKKDGSLTLTLSSPLALSLGLTLNSCEVQSLFATSSNILCHRGVRAWQAHARARPRTPAGQSKVPRTWSRRAPGPQSARRPWPCSSTCEHNDNVKHN